MEFGYLWAKRATTIVTHTGDHMNKFKTELKWSIIFLGATLVWMILERAVGLHSTHIDKHATYTNLFALVAIAVYVFALREKRDADLDGTMSYKEGLVSGIVIAVMVGILSPIGQLLTAYVISPHYFDNAITYAVSNALTSQEEAEAYFNLKNYIYISAMSAPILGLFTSAVVAFFVKTPPVKESTD